MKQEFPNEGPNAISVASIADLLCRLCMSEDCKEVDLDDAVDNLFALRVKLDPNSITESEDDMVRYLTTDFLGCCLHVLCRKLTGHSRTG